MVYTIRKLLILYIFIFSINQGNSQTISFAGNISTNTTWNADTIKITGDILLMGGNTLTINPGTYVEFQGYYSITCQGKIKAIGNAIDSIIFTIHDTTGFSNQGIQAGGWQNIAFPISGGLTPSDTSIFKYCSFSYSKDFALLKSYGELLVENCLFKRNNNGIYIYQVQNPNRAIIKKSSFINNKEGGVTLGDNCNALISNNTFLFNSAGITTNGGGILEIKNNMISNCLSGINSFDTEQGSFIDSNTVSYNQTGIAFAFDSNTVCSNNTIKFNGPLGGIIMTNSFPLIIKNNISNNTATGGAAIFMQTPSAPIIAFNNISNNYSLGSGCGYTDGGAILSVRSNPIILNNIISNNETESNGGAVTANDSSFVTLINNTIANNKANSGNGGGGLSFGWNYLPPVLKNNIIWGNEAPNQSSQILAEAIGQPINVDFCLVADTFNTYPNQVNYQSLLITDPLIVNPSLGAGIGFDGLTANWSLQPVSPCINAGTIDTTGLGLYSYDFAGNQRVQFGRIDIGAYESNSNLIGLVKNDFMLNDLILFPNPTNSSINLIIKNKKSALFQLRLIDVSGKVLTEENIDSSNLYLFKEIDLAAYNNGIYSLTLSFDDGTLITKSIVKY